MRLLLLLLLMRRLLMLLWLLHLGRSRRNLP